MLGYNYDIYGNRTITTNPLSSANFTYVAGTNELDKVVYNNRLSVVSLFDGNGSLAKETFTKLGKTDKEIVYTWDNQNRLAQINYKYSNRPAFMPAVPENTLNFIYDDYGNRTKKQATNGALTYYVNSGNTVLNEISSTGTTTKSIVYGLSTIAEVDTNNKVTYIHQDTLGSTVLTTDQSGSVVTKYEYDPFGQIIGQDGFTNTNYLYTNQEYDQESELYYYNARYYNPRLGRFISRDPYLGRDGDTLSRNGYTYVKNNPLKYVDPSGEIEEQNVFDEFANQGICGVNMSCETTGHKEYIDNRSTTEKVFNYILGVQTAHAPDFGYVFPSEPETTLWSGGGPGEILGESSDYNDYSVLALGKTITGKDADSSDKAWATFGAFLPAVSGGFLKNVFNGGAKVSGKILDGVRSYDVNKLLKTQPSIATSGKEVNKIVDVIKSNGPNAVPPIKIYVKNSSAYVVDGHHRLEAFIKAGFDRIPIDYVHKNQLKQFGRAFEEMQSWAGVVNNIIK